MRRNPALGDVVLIPDNNFAIKYAMLQPRHTQNGNFPGTSATAMRHPAGHIKG